MCNDLYFNDIKDICTLMKALMGCKVCKGKGRDIYIKTW